MLGFGCQICDVSLNSQEQLQQHRTGRKHLNKVKETGVGLAIHEPIEKEKQVLVYIGWYAMDYFFFKTFETH